MGICWGDPHFPTPTHTGALKSRRIELIISSSSCSGGTAGINSIQAFPEGFLPQSLKVFTLDELKAATRGFRKESVVGEGWFGQVFRGLLVVELESCRKPIVAVKRLRQISDQGHAEWLAEVNFLGSLNHPNIAKLFGFCRERNERLLVYEFAANGSLDKHLFCKHSTASPLPWDIRLKIAIGAARGLEFLHTSEKKIIFQDFKTSRILLDESYNAQLSGFGLALYADSETYPTTAVIRGSMGYAAPEYVTNGHIYVKSDVYGFGVVLLEMLTGLVSFDLWRPKEKQKLVIWAKPRLLSNPTVKDIIDSKANYPLNVASHMADLILKCIHNDQEHRPSMSEVVRSLEGIEAASMKQMLSS